MNLEDTKASFSNLSATATAIIFSILAASGGAIYGGITIYNRVIAATEAIEEYKPYDDNELKRAMLEKNAALEQENARLRVEVSAAQSALVQTSIQLARVQEKASEAAVAAVKTAISNATSAMQTMQNAVKQVADQTEATLKAAANNAISSTKTAAKARKG